MAERLTTRAARGAQWLDEVRPDWFRHVNLDRLDMLCGASCVLGQVYGDFERAVELLHLDGDTVTCYGFGLVTGRSWARLTGAWRVEVRERQMFDAAVHAITSVAALDSTSSDQ